MIYIIVKYITALDQVIIASIGAIIILVLYIGGTYKTVVDELAKIKKRFGIQVVTDNTRHCIIDKSKGEHAAGWRDVFQFEFNKKQIRIWFGVKG